MPGAGTLGIRLVYTRLVRSGPRQGYRRSGNLPTYLPPLKETSARLVHTAAALNHTGIHHFFDVSGNLPTHPFRGWLGVKKPHRAYF